MKLGHVFYMANTDLNPARAKVVERYSISFIINNTKEPSPCVPCVLVPLCYCVIVFFYRSSVLKYRSALSQRIVDILTPSPYFLAS